MVRNLSVKEKKEWILENCINKYGHVDLSYLDFSDFDGNVYFDYIKTKHNLYQNYQIVKGCLYQECQKVNEDLHQEYQKVNEGLHQDCQEAKGKFYTQTLDEDEEYECRNGYTLIVKKIKTHTMKELKEILGYDFEIKENDDE